MLLEADGDGESDGGCELDAAALADGVADGESDGGCELDAAALADGVADNVAVAVGSLTSETDRMRFDVLSATTSTFGVRNAMPMGPENRAFVPTPSAYEPKLHCPAMMETAPVATMIARSVLELKSDT